MIFKNFISYIYLIILQSLHRRVGDADGSRKLRVLFPGACYRSFVRSVQSKIPNQGLFNRLSKCAKKKHSGRHSRLKKTSVLKVPIDNNSSRLKFLSMIVYRRQVQDAYLPLFNNTILNLAIKRVNYIWKVTLKREY